MFWARGNTFIFKEIFSSQFVHYTYQARKKQKQKNPGILTLTLNTELSAFVQTWLKLHKLPIIKLRTHIANLSKEFLILWATVFKIPVWRKVSRLVSTFKHVFQAKDKKLYKTDITSKRKSYVTFTLTIPTERFLDSLVLNEHLLQSAHSLKQQLASTMTINIIC